MDKISVIIPIYNVEPYIRKCLDSVINQTYKNLEIICIDDGSTDNSGAICDEYSTHDNRIVIFHTKNFGVSHARNIGLDNATGEFIGFIDPDDWIDEDFYETLHNDIIKNNADISVINYFIEDNNERITVKNKKPIKDIMFNREDALVYCFKRDLYKGFSAYVWNKLFRKRVFLNDDYIRFNEKVSHGEGALLFTQLLLNSKIITYNNNSKYHYLLRNTSAMYSCDLSKNETFLISYETIISLLSYENISEDIVIYAKRFFVYWASVLAEMAYEQNNSEKLIKYQYEIKRYLNEYMETNLEYSDRIERIERLLKLII